MVRAVYILLDIHLFSRTLGPSGFSSKGRSFSWIQQGSYSLGMQTSKANFDLPGVGV